MTNDLLRRLNISLPIILAPLGGGPSTPELAAAVANAGGLGTLACPYLTPEQIPATIRRFRQLAPGKPLNVNLFAGAWTTNPPPVDPAPMQNFLASIHQSLGLPAPLLPAIPADPFPAQFEAMLSEPPEIFSFTFGIPSPSQMSILKSSNIVTIGTATTPEEAGLLTSAGCDAIIAQGSEAGGHRGTFTQPAEDALIPLFDLLNRIRPITTLPLIAAGGLMTGADISRALSHGASAAMLGTAFLPCPESGASPAYKNALSQTHHDTTILTRAFSGRLARGLPNTFTQANITPIPPYPLQNLLTRPMRTAANQQNNSEYLSLWAGQGVSYLRPMPAADLVQRLAQELDPAYQ